ncbi:ribosomal protein L7/L12 [bacterium]|nr:ribosomal protein L7/L12 [bacterium]
MIDMTCFYLAIAIMIVVIAREFLKKKYNINFDKIDIIGFFTNNVVSKTSNNKNINKIKKIENIINRKTGKKSLTMMDAGINKATVLATLRQITGIDYNCAKQIVSSAPVTFMVNISEKEASLTKQALEFVGAKIEIK